MVMHVLGFMEPQNQLVFSPQVWKRTLIGVQPTFGLTRY